MELTWDESKRELNLRKHGFDFADVKALFHGATVTFEDDRFDYGEERFITIGLLNGITVVVAHTETEREIRVISMRKATRNEQEIYFNAFTY